MVKSQKYSVSENTLIKRKIKKQSVKTLKRKGDMLWKITKTQM